MRYACSAGIKLDQTRGALPRTVDAVADDARAHGARNLDGGEAEEPYATVLVGLLVYAKRDDLCPCGAEDVLVIRAEEARVLRGAHTARNA